jgi:hypothetical protein
MLHAVESRSVMRRHVGLYRAMGLQGHPSDREPLPGQIVDAPQSSKARSGGLNAVHAEHAEHRDRQHVARQSASWEAELLGGIAKIMMLMLKI